MLALLLFLRRYWLWIVAVITLISASYGGLSFIHKQLESARQDLRQIHRAQTSIERKYDKAGRQMATAPTQTLSKAELQQAISPLLEEQERRFNVKLKRVLEAHQIESTTSGEIVSKKDSTGHYTFNDGYLSLKATVINDTLLASYQMHDTLTVLVSRGKRPHWWKFWQKRDLVTKVISSNPAYRVDTIRSFMERK